MLKRSMRNLTSIIHNPAQHRFNANNERLLSQPHFGLSVRMKLTLPKVRTWSPPRLPKTQSSSSEVKTPYIGVFFIPLESSWSVDVQSGLAWSIWTSAAQVMVERRAGSQIGRWSVTCRWKALDESYNFGSDLVVIRVWGEKLWMPKVQGVQTGTISGPLLGSPGKNSHLDVTSVRSCREYYKGEGGGFPQVWVVVSQVNPSARGLSQHPKGCRMSSNQLVVGFECKIV
jgi:hypothetical protein